MKVRHASRQARENVTNTPLKGIYGLSHREDHPREYHPYFETPPRRKPMEIPTFWPVSKHLPGWDTVHRHISCASQLHCLQQWNAALRLPLLSGFTSPLGQLPPNKANVCITTRRYGDIQDRNRLRPIRRRNLLLIHLLLLHPFFPGCSSGEFPRHRCVATIPGIPLACIQMLLGKIRTGFVAARTPVAVHDENSRHLCGMHCPLPNTLPLTWTDNEAQALAANACSKSTLSNRLKLPWYAPSSWTVWACDLSHITKTPFHIQLPVKPLPCTRPSCVSHRSHKSVQGTPSPNSSLKPASLLHQSTRAWALSASISAANFMLLALNEITFTTTSWGVTARSLPTRNTAVPSGALSSVATVTWGMSHLRALEGRSSPSILGTVIVFNFLQ